MLPSSALAKKFTKIFILQIKKSCKWFIAHSMTIKYIPSLPKICWIYPFTFALLFFIHKSCRLVSAVARQFFCPWKFLLPGSSPTLVAHHDQCTGLELLIINVTYIRKDVPQGGGGIGRNKDDVLKDHYFTIIERTVCFYVSSRNIHKDWTWDWTS